MGLLQTFVDKYKSVRQKTLNKKEFKAALFQAVNDGKLTKEEVDELEIKREELGLSEEEIKKMRVEVFTASFIATKSDNTITKEEEQELGAIQKYLGVTDAEIQPTKKELASFRRLNEIQQGNVPVLPRPSNVVMQKDEKTYWVEPAILKEEKVISRQYQGGSSGFSFRVMKGVSYRVGSSRGHLVSQTDIVAVSMGNFIITSKRLIFQGDLKSFAVKLDKILSAQLFRDGFQFSEGNKPKPRLIQFQQAGNQEIIGAILTYTVNHYGEVPEGK